MAQSTIYLVGPPVRRPDDIEYLLREVITDHLGPRFGHFTKRDMFGPVPFKSSWVSTGGVREAKKRPGLRYVDLWCVVCVWPPSFTEPLPWSVLVHASERGTGPSPPFETFLVTQPKLGRVGPQGVIRKWVRLQSRWQSRSDPHDHLEQTRDERQQDAAYARAILRNEMWQGLWNLPALVATDPAGISSRRSGSYQLDTAFPAMLPSFLNSCARRPKTFEEMSCPMEV